MPTQTTNTPLVLLLALGMGLAAVGLLATWLLMIAWRRHQRRNESRPKPHGGRSDLWQAAGDRLSARINQDTMTKLHGRMVEPQDDFEDEPEDEPEDDFDHDPDEDDDEPDDR